MLNECLQPRGFWSWRAIFRALGRLPAPDASATAHSKLCGSTVTVDLKMDDGSRLGLRPRREGLRARPGFVLDHGPPRHRLDGRRTCATLRDAVRQMLKENGAPPQAASGPTSRCSSRCATTRRAMPRRC